MINKFFVSDLHFGHANVIGYCNRPFASVEEMDETLVNNWNSVVKTNDIVYVLGDVFFHKLEKSLEIMRRLKGNKRLVLGNHDKVIDKNKELQALFDEILPPLHREHIDGKLVIMSHYPLLSWEKAHYGSYMLHGHSHGNIPFDNALRRLDVGVDVHNYHPINFIEIMNLLDKIPPADTRER